MFSLVSSWKIKTLKLNSSWHFVTSPSCRHFYTSETCSHEMLFSTCRFLKPHLCSRRVPHMSWEFSSDVASFCFVFIGWVQWEVSKGRQALAFGQLRWRISIMCTTQFLHVQLLYYCHWPMKQAGGPCIWQQKTVASSVFSFSSQQSCVLLTEWLRTLPLSVPHSTFVFCSQQLLLGNVSCPHAYIWYFKPNQASKNRMKE